MTNPLHRDRLDAGALSLGCGACPHLANCGGFMRNGGGWSCLDLCCNSPQDCDRVCPNRKADFAFDHAEVGGFGTSDIGPLTTEASLDLPNYIPCLQGATGRRAPLTAPWVALPLSLVCTRKDRGAYRFRYDSRAQMLGHLRLGLTTRVLLLCIGKDRHLERYWKERLVAEVPAQLAQVGVDAAIAPNFSFFLDEPLTQHLHNRKRSLICASEFATAGVPPVIYLHALSLGDWKLLGDILQDRPDVRLVCKEFQTGGVQADHSGKIRRVAELEQRLGRSLHLVAVGGARFVPQLQKYLSSWTVIDSTPYMRTVKRRRASAGVRRLRWTSAKGASLDALLSHNIGQYEGWISRLRRSATQVA